MHKFFSAFVLVADIALGIVAFAALFSAELSLPIKVLIGVLALLVAIHHQAAAVLGGMESDMRIQILYNHTWQIYQKLGGTLQEWNETESKTVQDALNANRHGGSGRSSIMITVGRFALWIGLGWALLQTSWLKQLQLAA